MREYQVRGWFAWHHHMSVNGAVGDGQWLFTAVEIVEVLER